jgi:hypothetical protein
MVPPLDHAIFLLAAADVLLVFLGNVRGVVIRPPGRQLLIAGTGFASTELGTSQDAQNRERCSHVSLFLDGK